MAGRVVLFIYYLSMEVLTVLASQRYPTLTLGIILTSDDNAFGAPHMLPAFDIALEKITKDHDIGIGLANYVLRTTVDSCDNGTIMIAPAEAAELYLCDNVSAFFGPSCSEETSEVADLAAYWQLPVLSAVAIDVKLDEKARFRTVTRTSFVASQLGEAVVDVFMRFQWNHVALLYSEGMIFKEMILGIVMELNMYDIAYSPYLFDEQLEIVDVFTKFRGMYHFL